jgi:5-methylcytosine-specific restriction endonuclease McrA
MNQLPLVLKLDIAGNPDKWITYQDSAYYAAKDLIAWSMAPIAFTLHGGTNAETGLQSTLEMNTIIAVRGDVKHKYKNISPIPPLSNKSLFRRDKNLCAYCGDHHVNAKLTRDHVIPRGQGGVDRWMNVVTACGPCNKRKDCNTPEESGMHLIYVPYAPNRHEWLILDNRSILADQMEFLMKSVPKESRLHIN